MVVKYGALCSLFRTQQEITGTPTKGDNNFYVQIFISKLTGCS
jgi:hypothetical protein